jgi:hypothetical protein
MRFVLIFCADNNERDDVLCVLFMFSLVFGKSALRPVRDDDDEEASHEDENEDENARKGKAILEKEEEHDESNCNGNASSKRTRCG